MECYSVLRRNEDPAIKDKEESEMQVTKWQNSVWKGHTLWDSSHVTSGTTEQPEHERSPGA